MEKKPIKYFLTLTKSKKMICSIIFIILLNIFSSYFSLIPAYLTQIIFDKVIKEFDFKLLVIILVLLITFFLISGLLNVINTSFYVKVLNASSLTFRKKYLESYLAKDFNSISNYSEGDIIYRGNNDIQNVCELSFEIIIKTITQLVLLIGILILMFHSSKILSLCVIIMMLVDYMYNFLSSNKLKNKVDQVKTSDSNLFESYKQIINRYIYIRLNRLNQQELERFSKVLSISFINKKVLIISQSILSGISGMISGSRQMLVLSIGAYLVAKGQLSIGILIAFNQLAQGLNSPAQFFSNWIHFYKNLLSSHERVYDIVKFEAEHEKKVIIDPNVKLICENVNCNVNGKKLIENVNLIIFSKEKVAVTGESGSGKSTLCKLIAGLYGYQGTVSVNDMQTNGKPAISFMLDESSIFRGTFWENMTYGLNKEQLTKEKIKNVLVMVKLEYLFTQTQELSAMIDHNTLSKGEKQRIELARIMLLKPELIILDEPTSGLDEETEKYVWDNFRRECEESTILYTTHKRSIIKCNDRILEMRKGKVFDLSSRNNLMSSV